MASKKLRTYILLILVLAVADAVLLRLDAQQDANTNAQQKKGEVEPSDSTINRGPSVPSPPPIREAPGWLFPVAKLDNVLPKWLLIGGEYRNRWEGPIGINFTNKRDLYLLSRLRLRAIVRPKDWLSFHAELQDARIFFNQVIPTANPYQDTFTLWQAYPEFGSPTKGWVDVLAGRQVLTFGDERVIGPSDWTNVGRTFNVARIDLHHEDTNMAVFASAVVPGDNANLHSSIPGSNLYGLYASFENNVVPKGTFEPYVLWHVAPANSSLPEEVGHGHINEVTIGLHWTGNIPGNFDYDSEFDGQTGSLGRYSIAAWAGYVSIGKTFPKAAAAPRIFFEGNYASGTKNPAGHNWNTFDQLYPSNHDKYGFADQFGRRNLEQFRVGIEEDATNRWKLKQQLESFWLATSNDNLYNGSGFIAVPAHPGTSRHIGNEADFVFEYDWNKGLSFGFGYGVIFAGQFLRTTTSGNNYQYPYAYFQYNFSKSGFHYPINSNKPNRPDYW
jgi:Alginate export